MSTNPSTESAANLQKSLVDIVKKIVDSRKVTVTVGKTGLLGEEKIVSANVLHENFPDKEAFVAFRESDLRHGDLVESYARNTLASLGVPFLAIDPAAIDPAEYGVAQFRKKPVRVEAVQMIGNAVETASVTSWLVDCGYVWLVGDYTNPESLRYHDQVDGDDSRPDKGIWLDPATGELMIRTLEGDMRVKYGAWVIRGVRGEFYTCDPDIFEQSYDKA